jgi:uncharacterized short protein YbdD (DUF466 family)
MERLRAFLRSAGDTARAMVGVGSYDAYRQHMAADHPDQVPMTEAEFVEDRQKAHYGEGKSGVTRCC